MAGASIYPAKDRPLRQSIEFADKGRDAFPVAFRGGRWRPARILGRSWQGICHQSSWNDPNARIRLSRLAKPRLVPGKGPAACTGDDLSQNTMPTDAATTALC